MADVTAAPSEILPSDPVRPFHPESCVLGHADEGVDGSVRDASRTPRAAAQRYFAQELGVGFADVSCRTTYGRALTRQEVWDDYGRDRAADDRIDELGLHCKFDPARGDGLEAFWYEDDEGRVVPDSEIEPAATPPAEWQPDDEDPVWTECERDAPGAVKIYILEERART